MRISVTRPELTRFIEDEVKAGHYPSVEAVVEAAIEDLRERGDAELDDETIAAINRADEQFARGEGIDFDQFAAEMRQKIARR
jgi:Arc/MetJ-type ribon-helix-helix transcriptional regulator